MINQHKVIGGAGVELHVVESGNPNGPSVLFIHGFSQCWLAWSRQLDSALTRDYHLFAMDLRGHGLSEKPRDAYTDSKLWADDVNAVIQTMGLERPVLSGWSYGPLVILDYIRHYGEEKIGGVQFVDGVSKLGSDEAISVLAPEFLALIPGFLSEETEKSVSSLRALVELCSFEPPTPEAAFMILGYELSVPPYVRQGLFSRSLDNDDLLPRLSRPVLITHGAEDPLVKLAAAERHAAQIPNAGLHIIENAGHAPFYDRADEFNQRLGKFVERCGSMSQSASL